MDIKNLISQDKNGTHVVLFRNVHALSEDDITQLFSEFGEVCNIRCCGDEKGFRFVRFKYLYEARRAIEGLKDNSSIQFAVPKDRHKGNPNDLPKSHDDFDNENSDKNANKPNHFAKNKKFFHQNKNQNYQKKNYKPHQHNFNNFNKETESVKSDNSWELPPEEKFSAIEKVENKVDSGSFRRESFGSHNTIHSSSMNEASFNEEEIPELVGPTKKDTFDVSSTKKVFLNAEEVIVGNIHPKSTAAYILHLFDQFEPLAITRINVIPKTNIRYCHVYFKSVHDSIGVETQFDKAVISGQKLVVLRLCKLIEEAA